MKHTLSVYISAVLFIIPVLASGQTFEEPKPGKWYRLVTRYDGGDSIRHDRCIQYFPPGSEHSGMLWSAPQAPESSSDYRYQCWQFRRSPEDATLFALVCMADTSGYVDPEPTAHDQNGRWLYVSGAITADVDRYGFEFVTTPTMSGVMETGSSYSAIESVYTRDTGYHYVNCGGVAQDYSINLWYEFNSEDANEWIFEEIPPEAADLEDVLIDDGDTAPVIYNLQGIRVTNPSSGIYIVNGRKVFIR